MSRVFNNWERLVRATLLREQLSPTEEIHGIAGYVPVLPDWVQKTTNINALLEAADEIEDEDPNLARILCEQAYSILEKLDPSNYGVGALQFKTGMKSIIKQQHLKRRDRAEINRDRDAEHLWDFYQKYKRQYRVDDIRREERRLSESGTLTANMEASPIANPFEFSPEVKGAISAIRYTYQFPRLPEDVEIRVLQELNIFYLLEYVFGFQNDNIRNQRENVILIIANAQSRLGISPDFDPKIDEKAITEVFLKVLENYIKWCRYLRIKLAWNRWQGSSMQYWIMEKLILLLAVLVICLLSATQEQYPCNSRGRMIKIRRLH